MPARDVSDDPLALVMMPPPDETAEERTIRLQREEEARRISEAIDESLRQERQMQKRKRIVKLLLLGQSESGVFFLPFYSLMSASRLQNYRKIDHIAP